MVGSLEMALVNVEEPRDFAGFVVFCVHARLRVGEAFRIETEPVLGLPDGSQAGFAEATTYTHQTRARGSKQLLTTVDFASGVKIINWAS